MSGKQANIESRFDSFKWALAILIFCGAIAAYYHFTQYLLVVRILFLLAMTAVSAGIVFSTTKGKFGWNFLLEAKQEMRKVIWPTRQETIHTTILVMIMVLLAGIFLWVVDVILLRVIAWITGLGGV